MAEPYLQTFEMSGLGPITSVVVDHEDFEAVLDELVTRPVGGLPAQGDDWLRAVDAMRLAGHVPLVRRGTKTAWLFERFGVDREVVLMSLAKRGLASRMLAAKEDDEVARGIPQPSVN